MKKFLFAFLFSPLAFTVHGQQDPLYAQYFNNPMLINPAFAGSNERLYAGVGYRSQWSGLTGGPVTFNFNSHMSLKDNKLGVGLMAVQDQLGDIRNTTFGGVFAYRIKMAEGTLSFGMQAGAVRYGTDPNSLKILNNPDPTFAQFNQTTFNIGAGALYQTEKYMISLSVPRLVPATVTQGGQTIQLYSQNIYLYGSYLFNVSEQVQFKPTALLRATSGAPVSADVNFNFVFNRLYTAGVFTRRLNTYGVLLQAVMKNYRLGYVFELPGKSTALNYTTNEISLSVSMDVLSFHNHSATGY